MMEDKNKRRKDFFVLVSALLDYFKVCAKNVANSVWLIIPFQPKSSIKIKIGI